MTTAAERTVLVLAEPDYRYGSGELRIRVDDIDRSAGMDLDGEVWLPVSGVQVRRDQTSVGPVRVLVRASRLPAGH